MILLICLALSSWGQKFQGIVPRSFLSRLSGAIAGGQLKPVKDEFLMLLEKWCQQKLGLSILDSEQLVLINPVAMFSDFHGFYLANRKEARLFCVEFWVWLFKQISV